MHDRHEGWHQDEPTRGQPEMTKPEPVQFTAGTCAECGCKTSAPTSFGVTTPLNGTVKPADFCSIGCLMDWAIDQHEKGLSGRA